MNPLFQKILAIGVTISVVAGFIFLVPVPFINLIAAKQDEIVALESTIDRYHLVLARAENLKAQSAENQIDLDTFFLDGRASSQGVAEIQGMFNEISREAGIIGGSFRPLPERKIKGAKRVGFRVSFQATTYAFLQLLEKADQSRPLMVLENLKLKAPRDQNPGVDPLLNIQVDVYGLQEDSNVS